MIRDGPGDTRAKFPSTGHEEIDVPDDVGARRVFLDDRYQRRTVAHSRHPWENAQRETSIDDSGYLIPNYELYRLYAARRGLRRGRANVNHNGARAARDRHQGL